MSRIQNVQTVYSQPKNYSSKKSKDNNLSTQSFGSIHPDEVNKATKVIADNVYGWGTRKLIFLSDNDSEIQTQAINAVFTATLAPTMIAFNPFSKSDEKTKKYSALRQPISAVIAIAGGVLLTNPVNNYFARRISEGELPNSMDLRMSPMKSYLMPGFNKALKEAPDKKAFWEGLSPKDFDDEKFKPNGEPTKAFKKACTDAYIKAKQTERQNLFTALLTENPKNIEIDEATSKIFLKDSGKEIGSNIPNLKTRPELDKVLKKNFYNMKFGEFMKKNFKLEVYDDYTPKPANLDYTLKTIKGMGFAKELGFIGGDLSFSEEELREKVLKSFQSEIIDYLAEKLSIPRKVLRVVTHAFGKLANVTGQVHVGESPKKVEAISLNQLLHRYDYVDDADKGGIKKFEGLLQKTVKEAIDELKSKEVLDSIVVNTKEAGKDVKKELSEIDFKVFGKNMVKNMVEIAESDAKNFIKYAGIVANVGIVMITCSALNWIYPRFVDAFFPHLSKSDTPTEPTAVKKGGN